MRLPFVVIDVFILLASVSCMAGTYEPHMTVQYQGSRHPITEKQLLNRLPASLKYVTDAGVPDSLDRFNAYVLPAKDSIGIVLDTLSDNPDILLVLYNTVSSVLSVLKRTDADYICEWQSGPMEGEGNVTLQDIDGDGLQEICASLLIGVHSFENVFFFAWRDHKIMVLNPSGKAEGKSEFSGAVDYWTSDKGLEIKVSQRDGGVNKTYIMPRGTREIKLTSESRREDIK